MLFTPRRLPLFDVDVDVVVDDVVPPAVAVVVDVVVNVVGVKPRGVTGDDQCHRFGGTAVLSSRSDVDQASTVLLGFLVCLFVFFWGGGDLAGEESGREYVGVEKRDKRRCSQR